VRSPESPGEGIGLPLARRLARGMGGDLRLETPEAGRGATFTLVLPVPAEDR
jgi:signal transduction histidine kinase